MKNVEVVAEKSGDGALREKALKSAMNLFWTRGAEVASYNEIVEATGLSRKTLYQYWPDKSALVRDTLDHYRRNMLSRLIGPLEGAGASGLAKFWNELEAASQSKNWCGCYLFRTAGGPLRSEDFVVAHLNSHLDILEEAFASAIAKGQQDGNISREIDAKLAGLQSVALIGLISDVGGQTGYSERVRALYAAARATGGLIAAAAGDVN